MEPPVGVIEIAKLLGVQDRTVHQWLRRELLPAADFGIVNGSRVWKRTTILKWAGETGRIRTEDLAVEFRRRWRKDPAPPRRGGRLPRPPEQKKTRKRKAPTHA